LHFDQWTLNEAEKMVYLEQLSRSSFPSNISAARKESLRSGFCAGLFFFSCVGGAAAAASARPCDPKSRFHKTGRK
jgi:hypothetical protein